MEQYGQFIFLEAKFDGATGKAMSISNKGKIEMNPEAMLPRQQLSEALIEAGYNISAGILRNKFVRGNGPPYQKFGNKPLYRLGDAIAWAKAEANRSIKASSVELSPEILLLIESIQRCIELVKKTPLPDQKDQKGAIYFLRKLIRLYGGNCKENDYGSKPLGRPPLAPHIQEHIKEALMVPGRPGVRKIATQLGVSASTVQKISSGNGVVQKPPDPATLKMVRALARDAAREDHERENEKVLTIERVMELSTLGRTSIYAAMQRGDLVARKFGHRTVIMESDFNAFMRALPIVKPKK